MSSVLSVLVNIRDGMKKLSGPVKDVLGRKVGPTPEFEAQIEAQWMLVSRFVKADLEEAKRIWEGFEEAGRWMPQAEVSARLYLSHVMARQAPNGIHAPRIAETLERYALEAYEVSQRNTHRVLEKFLESLKPTTS